MPRVTKNTQRYVAFLRAINVGGRGLISMKDLAAAFSTAGCANVRTYIASGNVLFDCDVAKLGAKVKKAQRALAAILGKAPHIIVRSADELHLTLKRAPFTLREANNRTKLYVIFLSRPPASKPRVPIVSTREESEIVKVTDDAVYLVSRLKSNGMFGFPNAIVEETVGAPATSRNFTTVIKVAELLRADPRPAPRRTSR